ncbi:MAG: hypothetical protein ACFBSE_19385 [Prochloraceae cyanobacterium]
MKTDFNFDRYQDLVGTVVFRSTFNNFETIDINQAWSLAISGGQEDKSLNEPLAIDFSNKSDLESSDLRLEWGKLFTNTTVIASSLGIIWCIFSNPTV